MFPGRSNKSEGGAVCLTENGRTDDLSLTPNDPGSRQILVGTSSIFQAGVWLHLKQRQQLSKQAEGLASLAGYPPCPTELEFSLRQRRWMLFYEIQLGMERGAAERGGGDGSNILWKSDTTERENT